MIVRSKCDRCAIGGLVDEEGGCWREAGRVRLLPWIQACSALANAVIVQRSEALRRSGHRVCGIRQHVVDIDRNVGRESCLAGDRNDGDTAHVGLVGGTLLLELVAVRFAGVRDSVLLENALPVRVHFRLRRLADGLVASE